LPGNVKPQGFGRPVRPFAADQEDEYYKIIFTVLGV